MNIKKNRYCNLIKTKAKLMKNSTYYLLKKNFELIYKNKKIFISIFRLIKV